VSACACNDDDDDDDNDTDNDNNTHMHACMYARARNTNTRTHTHTHTHAHAHVARAHTWKPPMYITPKVAKSALRRRSSVSRFSTTSCAMPSAIHVCTPAVDTAVATGRARAAALYALPTAIAGARRTCHARFAASIPSAPGRRTCHPPACACPPARTHARTNRAQHHTAYQLDTQPAVPQSVSGALTGRAGGNASVCVLSSRARPPSRRPDASTLRCPLDAGTDVRRSSARLHSPACRG